MKTFSIGDRVKVIGPSRFGYLDEFGNEFVISIIIDGGYYTANGIRIYPASSLELVEPELQIGDWVEVIGSCGAFFVVRADDPGIICIRKINVDGYYFGKDRGRPGYPASSLRKLTDDEIAERLNRPAKKLDVLESMRPMSVVYEYQPTDIENGKFVVKCTCGKKCEIAVESGKPESPQVSELGKIHEKLNWLQDQIDGIRLSGCAHSMIHAQSGEEISDIKKRLDFVERMQRNQSERKWSAGP